MGVYAETSVEITCKTTEKADKVYKTIKQLMDKPDNFGNFQLANLEKEGTLIQFDHSSDRVQNLSWQLENIWEAIKQNAEEMSCPFLMEADGEYFCAE